MSGNAAQSNDIPDPVTGPGTSPEPPTGNKAAAAAPQQSSSPEEQAPAASSKGAGRPGDSEEAKAPSAQPDPQEPEAGAHEDKVPVEPASEPEVDAPEGEAPAEPSAEPELDAHEEVPAVLEAEPGVDTHEEAVPVEPEAEPEVDAHEEAAPVEPAAEPEVDDHEGEALDATATVAAGAMATAARHEVETGAQEGEATLEPAAEPGLDAHEDQVPVEPAAEPEVDTQEEAAPVEPAAEPELDAHEEAAPVEPAAEPEVDAHEGEAPVATVAVAAGVVVAEAHHEVETGAQEGEATLEPAAEPEVDEHEGEAPVASEAEPEVDEHEGEAPIATAAVATGALAPALVAERKKRRRLLIGLALLLALLLCIVFLFWRYLRQPAALPDLLPIPASINYAPHYLFSIYNVQEPVGVALSPDGQRLYVTEIGGERMIRMFDREGNMVREFAPPRTAPTERVPVYIAVDGRGRVFVTDRLQRAVFVYDTDGNYLDTILSPDLTLSEYVAAHAGLSLSGDDLAYNIFEPVVHYKIAGKPEQSLPAPALTSWAPLGIRFDPVGNFLVTDVQAERHTVRQIPASTLRAKLWHDFDPPEIIFGTSGQGNGEFQFPNSAVMDSQGLIYVTDGNNGRISVWDEAGEFLFSFGQGIGESALSLPRGAVIDGRDRLHVVDAVEQSIKVYDVSGHEPRFLYTFGAWGDGDGEFNYPNDIALDTTGRLYIADRENNRVQIWSY